MTSYNLHEPIIKPCHIPKGSVTGYWKYKDRLLRKPFTQMLTGRTNGRTGEQIEERTDERMDYRTKTVYASTYVGAKINIL